jgi:hypothetical protein
MAFEAAVFPQWVRWFGPRTEGILTARDAEGTIAGTLLLEGPGTDTVLAPMLGPAAGTIGCVGVAPPLHGRGIGTALVIGASQLLSQAGTRACHIGWAASEVAPVGVHDTELVNLGVDVMAADQELVTGHGAASGDDENLRHIPPAGHCQGRAAPSRLAAYQDDDRLTFSTD